LRLPPTVLHDSVIHVDGNTANNHVSNLKYGTSHECSTLGAHAGAGQKRPQASKVVRSRGPGEGTWTTHPSIQNAAEARGVGASTVRRCCLQGCSTHSGLEFKYPALENLIDEEWKPAVHPLTGMHLRAMISSRGRVLNAKGICTWGTLSNAGYRVVTIGVKNHFVHRLVLSSFAASLPASWVVNHIDGDKQNNCLENLEPTTPSQNMEHSYRTNLRKPSKRQKPVRGRSLCSDAWVRFETVTAAAKHVGCSEGSIYDVCSGRYKSTRGWEFQNIFADLESGFDQPTLPGERWAPVVLQLPAD